MSQFYFDVSREDEPHALPDGEVFRHDHEDAVFMVGETCQRGDDGECSGTGWYWSGGRAFRVNSEPLGPFETEAEALEDAREGVKS